MTFIPFVDGPLVGSVAMFCDQCHAPLDRIVPRDDVTQVEATCLHSCPECATVSFATGRPYLVRPRR